MNKDKFFIGIGPPKTGTTWLYYVLSKHPEIELPRDKEIRYFWAMEYLGKNNFLTNAFGKHWHYVGKRKKFLPKIKKFIKSLLRGRRIDVDELRWHLKYFIGTQNDDWYESLFPSHTLSGDITPKYCELSEEYINRIKNLIPNCKIIISLRDPIDREWSRVKMNLLKRRNKNSIDEIDKAYVLKHFKNPLQHNVNNYSKLIENWSKYFNKEQIMVFYYDELVDNPQSLCDKICTFLEVDNINLKNPKKKFNKGIEQEIPKIYRDILIDLNYDFIKEFASKNPNKYSLKWLNKYKK